MQALRSALSRSGPHGARHGCLRDRFICLGIAATLTWCCSISRAVESTYYVARVFENLEATAGLPVIELPDPLPPGLLGQGCVISWMDASGQTHEVVHFLRAGRHHYEVRHTGAWKGLLPRISVAVPAEDAMISFEPAGPDDEWDIFLANAPTTAALVNVQSQAIFLLARRWEVWLALVGALTALMLRRRGRSWVVAAVIGFVAAWGLQDLRTWYQHWTVGREVGVYSVTMTELVLDRPGERDSFTARAAEVMGHENWSILGSFPGYDRHWLMYALAEHPYVEDPGRAKFVITHDRPWGETVVEQGKYRLGRRP